MTAERGRGRRAWLEEEGKGKIAGAGESNARRKRRGRLGSEKGARRSLVSEKKPLGVWTIRKPQVTSRRAISVGPQCAQESERDRDHEDSGFQLVFILWTSWHP